METDSVLMMPTYKLAMRTSSKMYLCALFHLQRHPIQFVFLSPILLFPNAQLLKNKTARVCMWIIYSHFVPPTDLLTLKCGIISGILLLILKPCKTRAEVCFALIKVLINAKYFRITKISNAKMQIWFSKDWRTWVHWNAGISGTPVRVLLNVLT